MRARPPPAGVGRWLVASWDASLDWLQELGHTALGMFQRLGRGHLFLLRVLAGVPALARRPGQVVAQVRFVGAHSALIILVSGLNVGMVLALQGYYSLVDFGAEESLGPMVALGLLRELGPVVTALLFAGRAGSGLAAEIGLMKATEQLAGMEMMAVDPVERVIAPRFVAGVLSMPLLAAIFSIAGVAGGYFVGVGLLGVDSGAFWSQIQSKVDFHGDLLNGMLKSLVFGVVATWIAVFEGFDAVPTTEGVSRATTRTVVHTSFAVLGLDFVLTALMFGE